MLQANVSAKSSSSLSILAPLVDLSFLIHLADLLMTLRYSGTCYPELKQAMYSRDIAGLSDSQILATLSKDINAGIRAGKIELGDAVEALWDDVGNYFTDKQTIITALFDSNGFVDYEPDQLEVAHKTIAKDYVYTNLSAYTKGLITVLATIENIKEELLIEHLIEGSFEIPVNSLTKELQLYLATICPSNLNYEYWKTLFEESNDAVIILNGTDFEFGIRVGAKFPIVKVY